MLWGKYAFTATNLLLTILNEDRPPTRHVSWICFDEIHKIPKWKNALKAIFDSTSDHYRFIVTGSAKLDLFKKAGDSLSGRYFTFNLFPLSLMELDLSQHKTLNPPSSAEEFIQQQMDMKMTHGDRLTNLLEFGGFPEPFLKGSKLFYAKWAQDYADTVIKEDVGALTMNLSEDAYSLFYIRTKEKEETDFVILKNKNPWLLIEVKNSDGSIAGHHYKTQAALGGIPFVQVCKEARVSKMESKAAYLLSASKFLGEVQDSRWALR